MERIDLWHTTKLEYAATRAGLLATFISRQFICLPLLKYVHTRRVDALYIYLRYVYDILLHADASMSPSCL